MAQSYVSGRVREPKLRIFYIAFCFVLIPPGLFQIKGTTRVEVIACVLVYGALVTPPSCILSNRFGSVAMAQDVVLGVNIGFIFVLGFTSNRLRIFALVLISRATASTIAWFVSACDCFGDCWFTSFACASGFF